jgi:hypothetical protein
MAVGCIHVRNAGPVAAKLKEMGRQGENYLRTSLRAGAVVMKNTEKEIAPRKSGLLASVLRIGTRKLRSGVIRAWVSPSGRALKTASRSGRNYSPWVEGGHFTGHRLAANFGRKFKSHHAKQEYMIASVAAGRKYIPGVHFVRKTFVIARGMTEEVIQNKLLSLIWGDWNS